MIAEVAPPLVLTLGAAWTYVHSPREFPDAAFSVGLLVVVASSVLVEITAESTMTLAVGYAGVAVAVAAALGFVDRFVAEWRAAR